MKNVNDDNIECSCPRCSGEGYESDFNCYRWQGCEGEVQHNCTTCARSNSYGPYGCPVCWYDY